MGIAAFLVWSSYAKATEDKKKGIRLALILFGIQLVLNTLWSIIFFGLHSPGGALVEIVFLWLAILATIVTFYKISKPAAWLLVPYIAWVSFVMCLNYAIWALN
jgi:tryptophan-rich sensory protein